MKYYFLTLICLLFASPGFTQGDKNQYDADGKKHGMWVVTWPSGKKKYEGNYHHGEPDGEFTYYHENGKVKGKMNHFRVEEGAGTACHMYHNNGKLLAKGSYVNREKDSLWLYYSAKGVLTGEEFYRDGKKHGVWKTYFAENGKLAELITYYYGNRKGKWEQYFVSGKPKFEGKYAKGRLDSVATWYSPKGGITKRGAYKDGDKEGKWLYFDEDGKEIKWEKYWQGVLVYSTEEKLHYYDGELTQNQNGEMVMSPSSKLRGREYFIKERVTHAEYFTRGGKKDYEGYYRLDMKDSIWTYYNDGGGVDSIKFYNLGEQLGTMQIMEGNRVVVEKTYENNVLHGPYHEYYLSGNAKLVGEYRDGEKVGRWTWYTEDGQVARKEEYE